jgi:hypothetical protein
VSVGLYSGVSGLALGTGLYKNVSGLWSGASGLIDGFGGGSPFGGASLYLNFLAGAPLDSRVTFSRGTNATLVDATGKITYAPANLLLQSQTFDNAAWTSFRSSVSPNSVVAPDGSLTADLIIPDTSTINAHGSYTTSMITVANSTAHIVSVYAKAMGYNFLNMYFPGSTSSVGAMFNLATGVVGSKGASVTSSTMTSVGDGWYRCSMTVTTSGTTADIRVYAGISDNGDGTTPAYAGNGTSGIAVWGAQLEPVTYQTTPSTYNATTSAAYYGPRFDYDPVTLAAKGLLIEEQRTNLVTYSDQFGSWVNSGATVTANTIAAPSGETSADTIARATSVSDSVYNSVTFTGDAVKTISVWIKKGTSPSSLINLYDATATVYRLWADVTWSGTTPVLAFTNGSLISSTNYGNGWWRLELAATTVTAANTNRFYIHPGRTGSVNGDTVYCWGAQAENATFATSYIPTVASQVTRSADVATMTGTNFSSWYNQTEGTLFAQATIFGLNVTAASGISALSNGTSAENTAMFRSGGANNLTGEMRDGGVTQATFTTPLGSQPFNVALAYATNNTNLAQNGAVQTTDTVCTTPTADRLLLGSVYSAGDFPLNGHIRQIAYYNTRLPNAQLQALTAPSLATTLSLSFTNQAYTVGV